MTEYANLTKDTLEYVRDLLRNDSTLINTILSLAGGTTTAVNNVFVGRPANEKINAAGEPEFPLPRIIIVPITVARGKMGDNQDGRNESGVEFQVSLWVNEQPWSLAFEAHDRIGNLLENNNMPVTNGYSSFSITGGEVTEDPDRSRTKQGNIRAIALIEGG